MIRVLGILALCVLLGGCFASSSEVKARLGQDYIGKNVDTLVTQWGPPTSVFKMNSGESAYLWQLSSETGISIDRNGDGTAKTYACKVNVIASPVGIVTRLDTEDYKAGGGVLMAVGALGSMCAQRLGIKQQG